MARNRGNLPIVEGFEITGVAAEGKSLGKWNDMVVFVDGGVPGDIVDLQIIKKRKRHAEGLIVKMVKPSEMRVEPFCRHFGVCGGCKWQSIPYEKQLEYKQQQVEDQLVRIGHLDIPEISPILGSQLTERYRNKLEFTFSPKRWLEKKDMNNPEITDMNALGFHIPGRFDKILDIEECCLQAEPSNAIRLAIKKFALENEYPFYDIRTHEGYLRNIIIRTSTTGEIMLIVIFASRDDEKQNRLLQFVANTFPEITSLMYVINDKLNDSVGDLDVHLFSGRDHIYEEMDGLRFKIGGKSFFQTNSLQARTLYNTVREFAELKPEDVVYDLYTGTGTIALYVARSCAKVVGVEYVEEAIADARINAEVNNINNSTFYAGDMKDVLNQDFIKSNGTPDVIILDPPRAGIHPDVAQTILNAAPRRIVYVSCNPATQARDLALLNEKYRITRVQPVDMFPHTQHVENVVRLEKID